jgi:protein associated with RNAse G/E
MNEAIVVHKLDEKGEEVWRYSGQLLEQTETSITLEARYDGEDKHYHGLMLRNSDRFVETFFSDRWYNVFAIHDVDSDMLKGWYCNVTRPATIEAGHVYADDLALDLIVLLDGTWKVLDEEQFADLELTLDERQHALNAITELQTMVVRRRDHFQSLKHGQTDS